MAKIIKHKRRKLRSGVAAFFLLFCALVTTVLSNLFVGSLKTSLMIEIQDMNLAMASLKSENEKLSIEIQTLQNKDRVYTIADDAGLSQNQDNVISVAGN